MGAKRPPALAQHPHQTKTRRSVWGAAGSRCYRGGVRRFGIGDQEQPVVLPQVSHFRQVPLRTRVKLPHSGQLSPS